MTDVNKGTTSPDDGLGARTSHQVDVLHITCVWTEYGVHQEVRISVNDKLTNLTPLLVHRNIICVSQEALTFSKLLTADQRAILVYRWENS